MPAGLRYDDEFVKHKILDAMGDLYVHRQAAAGGLQRVPLGPCAQQQAAARAAGARGRLRDRDLRRREAGAGRLRRSRARLVAPPRPMLLFRWAILLLLLVAGVSLRLLCRHRPAQVPALRLDRAQVDAAGGLRLLRGADRRARGLSPPVPRRCSITRQLHPHRRPARARACRGRRRRARRESLPRSSRGSTPRAGGTTRRSPAPRSAGQARRKRWRQSTSVVA